MLVRYIISDNTNRAVYYQAGPVCLASVMADPFECILHDSKIVLRSIIIVLAVSKKKHQIYSVAISKK